MSASAPSPARLAAGSALRTTNLFANAAVALVLTPMIVHGLGDRMYGVWALVASFIGYYGLLDLGLTSAATRYVARAIGAGDGAECNRVFNTALSAYLGMALIATAISAILAEVSYLWVKNPSDARIFAELILIMGTYTAASIPLRAFLGTLNAACHFEITAALDLLSLTVRAISIIVVIKLRYGVVALAGAAALSSLPSLLLSIGFVRTKMSFLQINLRQATWQTTRALFSYGMYTFISQIADTLRFGIDSLVVSAFVGLAAVTHYNIGGVLAQYFISTIIAILGVFQSVFSQREGARDLEGMKRAFLFAIKLAMWSAAFIAFGLIAWGKAFIIRWMGPSYVDGYPVLVALTIGCFFALAQSPAVTLLYATNNHRFYAMANVSEALANVVLSIVLVHRYGILGVALGTCIPMFVVKVFAQPVYVSYLCNISLRQYIAQAFRTLARIAIALIIPYFLARSLLRPTYPSLVGVGLLSAAVYVVPLFLYDFTSRESRLLLSALAPSVARLAPTER